MSHHKGRNEKVTVENTWRGCSTAGAIGNGNILFLDRLPASTASLLIIPTVTDVHVDADAANSTHLTIDMSFANSLACDAVKRGAGFFNVSKIFHLSRILGLMAVLSYMIVILYTWIYANLQGYVYFSAGEPISIIKYLEWILGIFGIFVAASMLRRELTEENIFREKPGNTGH